MCRQLAASPACFGTFDIQTRAWLIRILARLVGADATLENGATKAGANDCQKQVVACCSFFRSDWWGGRTCAEVSLIVGGKGVQGMQGHSQSWPRAYDLVVEHGTPAAAGPVQFAFQQAVSTHCYFRRRGQWTRTNEMHVMMCRAQCPRQIHGMI